MEEMIKFKENVLPQDLIRAKEVRNLAHQFSLVNEELYKIPKSGHLLKCITPEKAKYVRREIHEGVCGHPKRYYSLITLENGKMIVVKCEKCQKFVSNIN